MNEEELMALAEERNLMMLQREADEREASAAFNEGFRGVRPPEHEIRAQARPAPKAESRPSPKREARDFAQQVNAHTSKGDSGGSGSRVKPKPVTDAEGTYNIKKGDTLSAIAKRTGVSVQELARLNGINDINRIRAGDTLRLREAPPPDQIQPPEEGPSLLAQKIKEANSRGNPSALEAVLGININNKYNGDIKQGLDTIGNYVGATALGASAPLGGLLRSARTASAVPRRTEGFSMDDLRNLANMNRVRGWK